MTGENRSKGEQVADWIGLMEPDEPHVLGWCRECESVVWIDTELRPAGMADQCEEHEPLCRYQDGGCGD